MHFCAVELARWDGLTPDELAADGGALLKSWASLDPVEVMQRGWERTVRAARREGILGSSTALLALLRDDELRIANIGDCVLLIIRAGDLLFRSTEQQHSFNFPVQLGMMGSTAESVRTAAAAFAASVQREAEDSGPGDDVDDDPGVPSKAGVELKDASPGTGPNGAASSSPAPSSSTTSSSSTEKPSAPPTPTPSEVEWDEPRRDAGRWTVKVQRGDIIVIGSDGLVDNLFDEDILEEVLRFAPAPSPSASDSSLDGPATSTTISDAGSGDDPVFSVSTSASSADSNSSTSSNMNTGTGTGTGTFTPLPADFSPQLVSEALCSRAKAVSEDSRAVSSPFQQRASEEGLL